MKNIIQLLFLALFASSCVQHAKTKDDEKDQFAFATNSPAIKDSNDLPYFNPATMFHNQEGGYQDTFSVENNKFRIVHHDTLYDGILQKNVKGKWQRVLEFESMGNNNDYSYFKDINADGYNDVVFERKWDTEVFFYHHSINNFTDTSLRFPSEWTLLDDANKIFCNEEVMKTANGTSDLYTFKEFLPYYYYRLEYVASKDDEMDLHKIVLYKCENGNLTKKIQIEEFKPGSSENFDYKKYWSENYKRLMQNK